MPAYEVNINSLFECRYLATYQTQRIMTVLHYAPTDPAFFHADGPAFMAALALRMASQAPNTVLDLYKKAVTVGFYFESAQAQVILPNRYAAKTLPIQVYGTINSDGAPSNIACDIRRFTDLARKEGDPNHRGGTGVLHIAGLPTSHLVGNNWDEEFVSETIQPLAAKFGGILDVGTDLLRPVIWHRGASQLPYYTPITNAIAVIPVRTMSRRGLYRGI